MARTFPPHLITALTAAALAAACALAAGSAAAAEKPQSTENEASTKVWTNDSIRALRGTVSSFSGDQQSTVETAPQGAVAPSVSPPLPVSQLDPGWYRVQVAHLRADAARAQAKASEIQAELDSHTGGHKGNNLLAEPEGITPQSEIQLLNQRRDRDLKQIDALEEMARRNGIPVREILYEPTLKDYAIDQALTAPPLPEPQGPPKTEAQWRARFTDLRRQLAAAIEERDVLQREFGVAELQYYPNPNTTLKESITFHQENELRAKIDAQDAKIKALRQQLSDLEDALRRAGGPPGWSRPES